MAEYNKNFYIKSHSQDKLLFRNRWYGDISVDFVSLCAFLIEKKFGLCDF